MHLQPPPDLFVIEVLVNGVPVATAGEQAAAVFHVESVLVIALIFCFSDKVGVQEQGAVDAEKGIIVELFFNRLQRVADEVGFFRGMYFQVIAFSFDIADVKGFDPYGSSFFFGLQVLQGFAGFLVMGLQQVYHFLVQQGILLEVNLLTGMFHRPHETLIVVGL